jgi:agmatine deiminase
MEGGAMETNGKGVLLQCEQVTLERNPGWTKKQIEDEFRRLLNISKVIWLKKGTADDGRKFNPYKNYLFTGTGGHLDEFVRFADANTILLGWIDEKDIDKHPLNRITYERMKENLNILEKATDQDGNPFRIIKVPLPSIIELGQVDENTEISGNGLDSLLSKAENRTNKKMTKVAAVSYLNFLVTNDMIINASYVNHGTSIEYEERVKAIFKEVFPDREQVWIDVLPLNRNGGGIHCITHHEPFSTKKEIFVIPKT